MGDFNMPPGCSVRDIPVNRPEDLAAEAFRRHIIDRIIGSLNDDEKGWLSKWIYEAIGKAYGDGYAAGMADADLATRRLVEKEFP